MKKCDISSKNCNPKMVLVRVSYGSKSTPKELREYKLRDILGPIGTKKEWKKWQGMGVHQKFKLVFKER
jgi:hypothetical protein